MKTPNTVLTKPPVDDDALRKCRAPTNMNLSLSQLANALNGEVRGDKVYAPGPGHSATDRSLTVWLRAGAPDGFTVHSHAGDDVNACRDFVRERAGMPAFAPKKTNGTHLSGFDIQKSL